MSRYLDRRALPEGMSSMFLKLADKTEKDTDDLIHEPIGFRPYSTALSSFAGIAMGDRSRSYLILPIFGQTSDGPRPTSDRPCPVDPRMGPRTRHASAPGDLVRPNRRRRLFLGLQHPAALLVSHKANCAEHCLRSATARCEKDRERDIGPPAVRCADASCL